jgi:hypothetical protein
MLEITDILIRVHSAWRWIVILLVLAAIIKAFSGLGGKKDYTEGSRKLMLFAMVSFHIQILMGLVLYFLSVHVIFEAGVMENPLQRFFTVEHISLMIAAMILLSVGHSRSKKREDAKAKYKQIAIFYTLSFLIVLAAIPWPFLKKFETFGWF